MSIRPNVSLASTSKLKFKHILHFSFVWVMSESYTHGNLVEITSRKVQTEFKKKITFGSTSTVNLQILRSKNNRY